MLSWVIEKNLARSSRPGYSSKEGRQVSTKTVDAWLLDIRKMEIASIICLLGNDQLVLYSQLPTDLISHYQSAGFSVKHIPVQDHLHPPLSDDQLKAIWAAYQELPKPVLVHCSAGIDRTGRAVDYIKKRLSESPK